MNREQVLKEKHLELRELIEEINSPSQSVLNLAGCTIRYSGDYNLSDVEKALGFLKGLVKEHEEYHMSNKHITTKLKESNHA